MPRFENIVHYLDYMKLDEPIIGDYKFAVSHTILTEILFKGFDRSIFFFFLRIYFRSKLCGGSFCR